MNQFFKGLPLPVKLILIAVIPLVFLLLLGIQLYKEKEDKIAILNRYRSQVITSQQFIRLTAELQNELRYSFIYVQKGKVREQMLDQRENTDQAIIMLQTQADSLLTDFTSYTFLNELENIRSVIDKGETSPEFITSYYINAIFRINTLSAILTNNQGYLGSISRDLASQKVVSQMLCYMSIIRTNIFNSLYSGSNARNLLYGLLGSYEMYRSYEKELITNGTDQIKHQYGELINTGVYKMVHDYLHNSFTNFDLDSTYSAESWWQESAKARNQLATLQTGLQQKVSLELNEFYESELIARQRTILILLAGLVLVSFIVFYTLHVINMRLREINNAAQRISAGMTGVSLGKSTRDVIGKLAQSITRMDKNNKVLVQTAQSIGKGNFETPVHLRSNQDELGNAIIQMRDELKHFTEQQQNRQRSISKAILLAQEKERERLGTELHDNINQLLTSVHLYLGFIETETTKRDELIPKSKHVVGLAIEEIRKLSRNLVIPGLRDESLEISIKELVNDLAVASGIHFNVSCNFDESLLSPESKTGIYRIIQEQITNIIKYANATEVEISFLSNQNSMALLITDNGKGFELDKVKKGTGISSMISRCELMNSALEIDTAPGKGCRIHVILYPDKMKQPEQEVNIVAQLLN